MVHNMYHLWTRSLTSPSVDHSMCSIIVDMLSVCPPCIKNKKNRAMKLPNRAINVRWIGSSKMHTYTNIMMRAAMRTDCSANGDKVVAYKEYVSSPW